MISFLKSAILTILYSLIPLVMRVLIVLCTFSYLINPNDRDGQLLVICAVYWSSYFMGELGMYIYQGVTEHLSVDRVVIPAGSILTFREYKDRDRHLEIMHEPDGRRVALRTKEPMAFKLSEQFQDVYEAMVELVNRPPSKYGVTLADTIMAHSAGVKITILYPWPQPKQGLRRKNCVDWRFSFEHDVRLRLD